ncbi:MAG TPA: hypothetical protein PKA28_10775 [Methylomusa anaerophila]|uniref:hypothetical protein n=1 Tax=Methylomusa anaerophila TaxID=1930071 RepID=UPI000F845A45|nr:hypothetical protein [Methylomusa anaerophila]HML88918.1 hypothetical protein [Methylomusa anaerophila]
MARKKNIDSPPQKDTQITTSDKSWVYSTSETCQFFGVSAETLSNWEKRGAPKEGYGKWDIKKLVEWKYGASAGDKSPEARKLAADADYREAKAAQEAIKLAVAEGRYISAGQVTADLKRLFTVLKRSLMAIGHDIATELNTLDSDIALVAKKVVDDAVYNALSQLAQKGEYIQRKK